MLRKETQSAQSCGLSEGSTGVSVTWSMRCERSGFVFSYFDLHRHQESVQTLKVTGWPPSDFRGESCVTQSPSTWPRCIESRTGGGAGNGWAMSNNPVHGLGVFGLEDTAGGGTSLLTVMAARKSCISERMRRLPGAPQMEMS